jgi:hypothetical protein
MQVAAGSAEARRCRALGAEPRRYVQHAASRPLAAARRGDGALIERLRYAIRRRDAFGLERVDGRAKVCCGNATYRELDDALGLSDLPGSPRSISTSRGGSKTFQSCQSLAMDAVSAATG